MENRYQTYKDQGYKQYLLINAPDTFNGTPTASYCASIQSQYGLTFPVLYDPIGTFTSTFGFGCRCQLARGCRTGMHKKGEVDAMSEHLVYGVSCKCACGLLDPLKQ